MTRLLVACWLLFSLCLVCCTTKKTEDQPPNQDITSSSLSTSEAVEMPPVEAAPEAVSTPDPAPVAPAPKVVVTHKAVTTHKAVARISTKKVASSPAATELVAAVESPASPTYRPRSARASGYLCDTIEFIKYEKLHDGEGGFMRGKVLAQKSRQCGFVAAVVRKESPAPSPVASPVASKAPMPPVEQWVADAQLPEKCEDGILYKYEKSTQTGIGRKTKVGSCPVESAKPDYLNKTIQQVKDDGLIKKGESGSRKKDN
ncbi:MAG: hypothetical protein LH609_13990 [Rudanella sp.]|nr:hypothetical protein [Rudanella sp.]